MAASQHSRHAPGTIYLLHFSGRTRQWRQHYLGWSSNIERRLAQHRAGRGATETRKALAEGLTLTVAQTWSGSRLLERRIKEWSREEHRGFAGICPFCAADDPLPADLESELGAPSLRVRHLPST